MNNCVDCDKADVCPKSKHAENYKLKSGCRDHLNVRDILECLFSEIAEAMDKRSNYTHTLSSGSLEPCQVYDSELANDINFLRIKYLGEFKC